MYAEFSSHLPEHWEGGEGELTKQKQACVWAIEDAAKNKTVIKGNKFKGKIVMCDRSTSISFEEQAKEAARAGAVGLIIVNTEDNLLEMKSSCASVRAPIPAADSSSAANTSLDGRKSRIPVVLIKSSDGKRLSKLGSGEFHIKDKGHPEAKNENDADEEAAVDAFVGRRKDETNRDIPREDETNRDIPDPVYIYRKHQNHRDFTTFAYNVLVEEFEIESVDITDEQWSRLEDADTGESLVGFCKKIEEKLEGNAFDDIIRKEAYFCEIEEARLTKIVHEHQNKEPWVNGSKWANFFLSRLKAQIKSDREKEAADKKKEAVSEAEAVRNKARDVSDLGFFLQNVLEEAVGDFEPERLCAELQTHGIDSVQRLIQCFDSSQEVSIASSPNSTIFSNNSSELLFRLVCHRLGT